MDDAAHAYSRFEDQLEHYHRKIKIRPQNEPEAQNLPRKQHPNQADMFFSARPQQRKGAWTYEEHENFLYALRVYGKDWRMIQWKIGTRDRKNILSHAEKYKVKLSKIIKESHDPHEIADAERYRTILDSRQHKLFSNQLGSFGGAPEAVDLPHMPGIFLETLNF